MGFCRRELGVQPPTPDNSNPAFMHSSMLFGNDDGRVGRRLQIQLLTSWSECVRKMRAVLASTLKLTIAQLMARWVRYRHSFSST